MKNLIRTEKFLLSSPAGRKYNRRLYVDVSLMEILSMEIFSVGFDFS